MSMLTPRGMRGQYKITGKLYPRMTHRRRKWPIVVACLVAVAVLGTGAWAFHHYSQDDAKTAATAPSCTPTPSGAAAPGTQAVAQNTLPPDLPPANTITINVYNSTDRTGLAKSVADELKARGFLVGTVANDPLRGRDAPSMPGPGELRTGVPGKTPSLVVGAHATGFTTREDARTDATVDLVLGEAFQALAAPEAATAALAPATPGPANPAAPAGC
ncbi:LytR C-terminal domain-containing protein [Yinghuangia sp. ASG 101]|uniref:LytR C-terminal domain-containing protein n=1 Tax=Yinghuangia sp. ASG 101 TaxID=2896848 RepID=UPI001E3A4216|nr:LytR C-terminal domain-containing protein [Yinghuangia sp. ASG 101]UGQ08997.1 LytR C-terminal domain-containing protein [Yinghuangia sp. ASG 101]